MSLREGFNNMEAAGYDDSIPYILLDGTSEQTMGPVYVEPADPGERTQLLQEKAELVFGEPGLPVKVVLDESGKVYAEGVEYRRKKYAWLNSRFSTFCIQIGETWKPIYTPRELREAELAEQFGFRVTHPGYTR